jgi:hypothetical protein
VALCPEQEVVRDAIEKSFYRHGLHG